MNGHSNGKKTYRVAVIGGSGGIGQPLSMLIKMNPLVTELAIYDIKKASTPPAGVAADLSHINTACKVSGYAGDEELGAALKGCHVVLVVAGGLVLRPGMTRDDLFNSSASIIKALAESCAVNCPTAFVAIVTNPVNSMVPLFVEVMKKAGVTDCARRVLGVTTLDVVRASAFVADKAGFDPKTTNVPCVGGHGGESILALVSQSNPPLPSTWTDADIQSIETRVKDAAFEVVNAKGGAGSATLSMAFAAARFADSIMLSLSGTKQTECCYVATAGLGIGINCDYFAGICSIGASGVESMQPMPTNLRPYEQKRVEEAVQKCQSDVVKGIEFFKSHQ